MMLIYYPVNSDWLFNSQLRVLSVDWLILENNEKATLNIDMPYYAEVSELQIFTPWDALSWQTKKI